MSRAVSEYKYEKEKVQPCQRIFFVRKRREGHFNGPFFPQGNEPLGQHPHLFVPFTGRSKPLFFKPIEERQPAADKREDDKPVVYA